MKSQLSWDNCRNDARTDGKVTDGDEVSASARRGFLHRIYGIVTIQLTLTSLVGCVVLFTPILRFYINENAWLVTVGFLSCVILLLALMGKRSQSPINYILLIAFTVAEVYTVAVTVVFYDKLCILQAFILSMCSITALTAYAWQIRRKFIPSYAGLLSCAVIFLFAGLFQILLGSTQMEIVVSVVGAVAFSLYVIYDTRSMINNCSSEEYVLATIDLYLDIIFARGLWRFFTGQKKVHIIR